MAELDQTQGQNGATEAPIEDALTDVAVPEDLLDSAQEDADELGAIVNQEDPLSDIDGADRLPEEDQRRIRDSYLRKMSELDRLQKQLQERDREYLDAIKSLKGQDKPEADSYEGLTPQQIVEKIAANVVDKALADKMKSLDTVRTTNDALVRRMQILDAHKVYPDVEKYQDQLVDFSGILEQELGKENASKFSVTDMMHIIKGRELSRRKPVRKPTPPPATRKPEASIARPGVAPSSVEPATDPASWAEAWALAKKKLGVDYNPNQNR